MVIYGSFKKFVMHPTVLLSSKTESFSSFKSSERAIN